MRALLVRRLARPQAEPRAAVAGQRQQQIVPDGVRLEHRRLLELAADAQRGDRRLIQLRQVGVLGRTPPCRYPAGSCR